jgi:hypothetical protein
MSILPHHTDASLIADLASTSPGPRRQARILLTVHPDDRADVAWEANRMWRCCGGRYSDALWSCAQAAGVRRVPAPA